MAQRIESPGVSVGGLVTVAFLKAQIDAGSDHLGMFMPLVLDVIYRLPLKNFTTDDIQTALSSIHNVAMPKHVIATLLRRASKDYLDGDGGVYRRKPHIEMPPSTVDAKKQQIERGQLQLAAALMSHAERRKLSISSSEAALEMLFRFLDAEQVALLLENPTKPDPEGSDERERAIIAEFIENVVFTDPALLNVLRQLLEGLVLYHAAFLPDLANARQRFRSLRVVLDSSLVREALGYEGQALKALLKEAIEVLKASGIECVVFTETLEEIRRLLAIYESKLATTQGRSELKRGPMTRHFLTQLYDPSDIIEMSSLLERDIAKVGIRILTRPVREFHSTSGEKGLAARLRRPNSGADSYMEPRVEHDVNCIAAVLTLRRGRKSNRLEDAGVVFATDSVTVIRTVQAWWREDEEEAAFPPIVHIRTVTNLAWLKKPALCADFKIQELVTLCSAALHPKPTTWEKFLKHLAKLQKEDRITSDEAAAIVVSDMLDRALKDAEFESSDPNEVDAATLDEAVDRVKASYAAAASARIQAVEEESAVRIAAAEEEKREAIERAEAAERSAAEAARRRAILIQERACKYARRLTRGIQWLTNATLLGGAAMSLSEHRFHPGWPGILGAGCVVLFILLEFIGAKRHVAEWLGKLGEYLTGVFLRFFETG